MDFIRRKQVIFFMLLYAFLKTGEASLAKKPESAQPQSKDVQWSSHGVKIPCKSLSLTEEFKCSASELYRALTDKEVS